MVSDSGPIIAYARIGRLELLHQVCGELVVPGAVYHEIVVQGSGRPGAEDVEHADWIRQESVQHRAILAQFPSTLESGEREAIILAEEQQATLLMDDWRAREMAVERGLLVVGVLWVLGEAKRLGVIQEVRPIIDELVASGYRLHPERVIGPFLREMGEEDGETDAS